MIRSTRAIEILDSRGNPTVWAEVTLANGVRGAASVPSGASTGTHEAVALPASRAVHNVNEEIAALLAGMDAADQAAIDRRMIECDGTPNKSRLGANAILAVSCAVARAAAAGRGIPLWRHLAGHRTPAVPVPMVNIFSGGLHAGRNIEFQDFLVIPRGFGSFREALEKVVAVHRAARAALDRHGLIVTGTADEGGWGPRFASNEQALEILAEVATGFDLAIDVAATHFPHQRAMMIDRLEAWVSRFPVVSIEDGLAEDDWDGWRQLTARLGARVQLIGDDLFCTNRARLDRGIAAGAANAILVKMNQAGTLTETFEVIDRAREAGYRAVISARSGETEDDFLADLAVASGAGQIKVGSVRGSERLAKYNRLLRIESQPLPTGRGSANPTEPRP
jgi:enolase